MVARFKGRLVTLPNPAEPCAKARKPVSKISDRAKRYRANQAGCKPNGPRRCMYCGGGKHVGVHHLDGDESNGRRSNLGWACKSCNALLAAAFKRAGKGTRVRQLNPRKKKGRSDPAFTQYGWAVSVICRHRDQAAGRCSPANDDLTRQAVAIIRGTSPGVRREYARRAAAMRGRYAVPF